MTPKGIQLPPKKDVARALLLRGNVFVHLDPRRHGVTVPTWLQTQPQLVLQVGLDMPIPIPDLRVDDAGVYGTLSFQRAPFTCSVPWSAVFALVGDDNKGVVWPDDLPPEIATEIDREVGRKRRRDRDPDREITTSSRRNGGRSGANPRPALATAEAEPEDYGAGDAPRDSTVEPVGPSHKERNGRKPRELPPYLRVIK